MITIFRDLRHREAAEQKLLDYQNRLRELTSQLALAEERERRRIAAGLHDRTVQTLGLIKIKLGQLEAGIADDETRSEVPALRELLEETIRETRSLMFELSPPVLYELGFVPAIEWPCQ